MQITANNIVINTRINQCAAITGAIAGVSEVASKKILDMSKASGVRPNGLLTSNADESLLLKPSSYEQSSMIKAPAYEKTDWSLVAKADDKTYQIIGLDAFGHKMYPGLAFDMRAALESVFLPEQEKQKTLEQ